MLDLNQLNELAAMQRWYAEIYKKTGLAGIDYKFVHLSTTEFLSTFKEYAAVDRDCDVYPYELQAYHLGVKFICLLNKEEGDVYLHKL